MKWLMTSWKLWLCSAPMWSKFRCLAAGLHIQSQGCFNLPLSPPHICSGVTSSCLATGQSRPAAGTSKVQSSKDLVVQDSEGKYSWHWSGTLWDTMAVACRVEPGWHGRILQKCLQLCNVLQFRGFLLSQRYNMPRSPWTAAWQGTKKTEMDGIGNWGKLKGKQSFTLEEARLGTGREQAQNGLDWDGYSW